MSEAIKDWEIGTIGSLIARDGGSIKTGPFGTVLKAAEYSRDGVPLISVGEIGYGFIQVHTSTPRAPAEVVARLPEYVLRSGDIVFARKGSIDRSAIVTREQDGWFLGSDGIRLRLPSSCEPRFIAYHFQNPRTRSWLEQHSTGSTMPSLNQGTIERVPVELPSRSEQKAIAAILGALDDKIELNRRTNAKRWRERCSKAGLSISILSVPKWKAANPSAWTPLPLPYSRRALSPLNLAIYLMGGR